MLPWKPLAEGYAAHADVSLSEIADASDEFLIGIMHELGFSRADMVNDIPGLQSLTPENQQKCLDAIGFEKWTVENIRRGAREETPLPLGIGVGGVWIDTTYGEDWAMVWAVATPHTHPDAMAKTFLRKCRVAFGTQASKDVSQYSTRGRAHVFSPEEMAAMHQRGMSYREIAIQSLREEIPEIIERPEDFKSQINDERDRIIWVIRAARKLWSSRMPEDSIG